MSMPSALARRTCCSSGQTTSVRYSLRYTWRKRSRSARGARSLVRRCRARCLELLEVREDIDGCGFGECVVLQVEAFEGVDDLRCDGLRAAAAFDPDQTAVATSVYYECGRGRDAVSDFCYSRPMLNRIIRQAELMDRMMERVGVIPAAAACIDRGMAWYEARTRCIACCSERECRDWLARSEAETSSEAPEFCHNADFFRRCGLLGAIDGSATRIPPGSAR